MRKYKSVLEEYKGLYMQKYFCDKLTKEEKARTCRRCGEPHTHEYAEYCCLACKREDDLDNVYEGPEVNDGQTDSPMS